jgi:hypothetical protein
LDGRRPEIADGPDPGRDMGVKIKIAEFHNKLLRSLVLRPGGRSRLYSGGLRRRDSYPRTAVICRLVYQLWGNAVKLKATAGNQSFRTLLLICPSPVSRQG